MTRDVRGQRPFVIFNPLLIFIAEHDVDDDGGPSSYD